MIVKKIGEKKYNKFLEDLVFLKSRYTIGEVGYPIKFN